MAKEVALFENQALPAHLQTMFGDESNIDSGSSVNALSIRGKVFRIVYEGEEKAITKYNDETGDREPVSTLNVIVLNQGPFGARLLYDGAYSPDNNSGPICFSLDGKHPDAAAEKPQAKSCADCPHAVKGSKVTPNGTLTTACQLQRRLAIVPASKPNSPPLLLRLAPTSAYDPDTKGAENGWMAWRQYMDFLSARGVRHTAQLVTTLRFDPNAEHPKLLFKANRFIDEDEALVVAETLKGDAVKAMLHPSAGTPAQPVTVVDEAEAPKPAPKRAVVEEEVWEEEEAPKPKPAPKPAPKPKAAAEEEDWELEEDAPPPPKKAPARRKTAAKKSEDADEAPARKPVAAGKTSPETDKATSAGSAVDSLLDDWDA